MLRKSFPPLLLLLLSLCGTVACHESPKGPPGLSVEVSGRSTRISAAKLDALAATELDSARLGRHMRRPQTGLRLSEVLALVTDLGAVKTVTIRGAKNQEQTIGIADVRRADGTRVLVKRNKSGLLVVRWIGADDKRVEVRGATHIALH